MGRPALGSRSWLCHTSMVASTSRLASSAVYSQASPLSGTRRRFGTHRGTCFYSRFDMTYLWFFCFGGIEIPPHKSMSKYWRD